MLGFGVSDIGQVCRAYSASVLSLNAYYAHLDEGRLPIERGFELTDDDVLRRQIIMTLMCSMPLDYQAIRQEHGIDFASYFQTELERLAQFEEIGREAGRERVCQYG